METSLEILYPPKTHHEQTDGWFRHELDSHDGIFLQILGMRGRCEFPAGMLFVCPCSTPDVGSPLCRRSPSTARPPLWRWLQCQSVWGAPDSLSLQPLSLSRKQPPFFHFFLFNASGDPPFTFEAVSADPAPTSPKPRSLVRLFVHASLPLLLPSVFSLQSALNTKAHADMQEALRMLSRSCSGGFNLHQWCSTISGAPAGNADTHLSTQQIECKETPPWRDVPCLVDRLHETKTEREEKEGKAEACQKTENDGGVKRTEMWWWEQPLGKEFHTVLSVNEGGWGRGRRESNGNAASKSRPRLSTPAERWGMLAKYTSSRLMRHACSMMHVHI